ncbi:MAG: exo-beta-N-acetylmuramidase NamZ domain-containing protein [Kiritimatiellia bacterium]|jgi:uncharacterized protein YbbC (DUF1343 family)
MAKSRQPPGCAGSPPPARRHESRKHGLRTGIDVLRDQGFAPLRGRRVGLLSHRAAIAEDGRETSEILRDAVNLVAMFGPEHGYQGIAGAGEATHSYEHPEWRIPVHSLYGATREPTPEMLDGLDCVVCDLQDLGVRCYTYLATLRNMMRACDKAGVDVVVLDRPTPLPNCVDGPIREAELDSFVAPLPVPFVHGMTPAEAARWMQRNLLPDIALATVPMDVAGRDDIAFDALPRFARPSPGIRSPEAAMIYPMTVFTEAVPSIDCGLGTDLAFQVFGAPWLDGEAFCDSMQPQDFPGIRFEPQAFVSAKAYAGRTLHGVRIVVEDRNAFKPFTLGMRLLNLVFKTYGRERSWDHPGTSPEWFDKLFGAPAVREALLLGQAAEYDNAAYLATRGSALLY